MLINRDIPALRRSAAAWRRAGERIALVPTMGNLHAGHLALVEAARAGADRVVVSIFVNPIQFVAGEDYDSYPRSEAEDCRLLETIGTDLVYMPDVASLFPQGLERHTRVRVPGLEDILCGASRPGHFSGVATVVTKLLNLVQPDVAVFGEKDYQQLLIIRRLVADLALPVTIEGVATVREADGLALSSRNAYLSAEERRRAPALYRTLMAVADRLSTGVPDHAALESEGLQQLESAGLDPEYLAIRDAATLAAPAEGDCVVLAAARLGRARLIDNIRVPRGD